MSHPDEQVCVWTGGDGATNIVESLDSLKSWQQSGEEVTESLPRAVWLSVSERISVPKGGQSEMPCDCNGFSFRFSGERVVVVILRAHENHLFTCTVEMLKMPFNVVPRTRLGS